MTAARTGTCTFLISIDKNTTTSARTGTVTISGGGVSCTVTVNQERIPLTIKLDANGGSVSTTSFTRYYGDKLGTIPAPKVPDERYVFAGWYTAVEGGTRVSADTVVKDNMTLYARWKYSVLELNAAASEIYYGQGEKFLTTEHGSIVNRSYTYSFSANGTGASLSPNVVGWAVPNDYTIAVYCSENWTVRGSTPWIKVYNADTKTEVTGGSAGYYELFIVVGDNFTQNPGSWKLVGSERNGSVVFQSNSGKTRSVAIKQYGPGETQLRNNGGQRTACLNRALVDPSSYDKYITELEFFTLGTKLHHIDNNTYVVTRCQATGCGLSGDYYPTMTLSTDYIIFEVEHDATAARIKVVYASDYSANSLSIDDITCKYTAKSSPFSMEPIIKAEVNNKVGEAAYKLGDFLVGTVIDLSEKIPVVGKPINITAKVFVGAVEVFDGANASMSDGYTIEEEMSTDIITQTSSVVYVESATITASGIKLAEKGDQLRIENNFIGTNDVSIKVTVKIGGYSFTF
ncbi:MAG: InlB B-repeat-containing protein [Clostridia bacterium]|nr:InlB B-repeat-containing protein [Clostridia bacterium]